VLEKQLVALIETYPDSLLQSNGENQLVLGKLAKCECPLRKVWHTAGRLCTHAFICATQESLQPLSQISCESPHPLYHMPFDLIALVENFMDCPLDWTQNEGALQDGELAGVILYYTFKALLEENHGLDSNSKIPLSHNLVMPCSPVYNNYTTVKTTLLHMLAYCSKFCAQHQMEQAVDSYASRQSAHFFQSDNNGNLPLHLVCCAPPPSILVGVYDRRFRGKTEARLVETFLTPCVKAASITNHLGKTPLDILMESNSELSELNIECWRCVELLVNANPTEANKLFTKEKMYPFMIAAIGEQANISCTFSMLLIFVSNQNLDDLQSRMSVQKNPKAKGFLEMNDLVI